MPINIRRLGRSRLGLVSRIGLVAVAVFVAACGNSTATGTPATQASPAGTPAGSVASSTKSWLDTTKTVDQRVAALLSQMTQAEKIGQMTQVENGSIDAATSGAFAVGSILSGGGGSPKAGNTPQAWYDMVNGYQQAALGTRLGIPMLYGIDAVHGNNNIADATIFPQNVGMGATNDPALVTKECAATALEMNAVGIRWSFGPVIAVPQDIRWGRTFEGYSENTDLVSKLGTACVQGFQGKKLTDPNTVVADPKHFIGDGGTAFGSSTTVNMTLDGINVPYLLDQGVDKLD